MVRAGTSLIIWFNVTGKIGSCLIALFGTKVLSINAFLLLGPMLSSTLLGVLRFREHSVGMSGDIRGMFHQVLLLSEDKPLLRFLWHNMQREETPQVYEKQVLPIGTTCSDMSSTTVMLIARNGSL